MPIQIPSYIKNPPSGSNVPNPSVHATPQNINPNPKRSKIRMLLFVLAIVILGAAAGYYFFIYTNNDTNDNTNLVVASSNINQNINQNLNSNIINNSNLSNTNNLINLGTSELNILEDMFADDDEDLVINAYEEIYGTNINQKDSDKDGFDDNVEIGSCYNPISSGLMNGQYYSTIVCMNEAKQLLEVTDISDTAKSTILNSYADLCNDWADFAGEVIEAIATNGSDFDELYSTGNLNFITSCDATTSKYNNNELNDIINNMDFISENAEDFCFEFSSGIKYICGSPSGF